MTIKKTARFTVHPDNVPQAVRAIETFLRHTAREAGTVMYASWRSDTRPTEFLHIMEFADARAERAHAGSAAVRSFTAELYPLCIRTPEFEDWRSIPME